ncbi:MULTISPECIES: hypothetical protein [Cyanophyceae]|uniref:hypothetical protein n=1 Tax=Cyanophyceae TaxID=3028117 RepID=UPI00168A0AC7|nr:MULTISPECIES: hypothetical protein [Cyanophyceae]MBD1914909.1 hypothetical protein [Phormidium sp. FACHB-77]MBD2028587.1 hypothetical protein [Phormidium sp. FACHB-322]MBD2051769.1 hypothetical protein [Leptolyngbya sp. FACHB-60]
MATSSRSFRSQTVARLVAGYRQVAHSTGQWLRQGRIAAVWGLQVAVYPLYAAVQGLRMGYRRLQATRPWRPVWARLTGALPPELVAADTPIRALLSVIQPPVLHSHMVRPGRLQLVNVHGQWLKQSKAGAVLTPGQWHLVPLNAPIRGIASDLATRQLVLVTVDNGIFAGLSEDQQQRLEQALVLMLAEYARVQRRHSLDSQLHQPGLPLPQTNPAVLPPLRWLPAALRWLQTSPLAAATNLFGEADQQMTTALAEPGLWPIAPGRRTTSRAIVRQRPPATAETTVPETIAGQYPPQLNGQPAFRTLPTTTSVEQGVELAVAMPGTVSVANSPALAAQGHDGAIALGDRHLPIEIVTADRSPSSTTLTGTDQYQLDSPSAIDVKVTQINYVDLPLVSVLRGLDWVLYALETWLQMAWAWLRSLW